MLTLAAVLTGFDVDHTGFRHSLSKVTVERYKSLPFDRKGLARGEVDCLC